MTENLDYFLPPEVWEQVFRDLSSEDFLSVINSCPEWRELLKLQTTTALLPLVLPFLLEYIPVPDSQLVETFISWRAINRGAKESMDNLLQIASTSSQTYYEYVTGISKSKSVWLKQSQARRLTYFATKRNTFRNAEDILKFLTHFGEFSRKGNKTCPFLTKSISLEIQTQLPVLLNPDFVNVERLWMLSQYGQHLSDFTCNIADELNWSYVLHFLELLENSPNIKILRVGGDLGVESRGNGELHFPELKKLELLNLEDSCGEKIYEDEALALGPELVKHYGTQLKTLICRTGLIEAIGAKALNTQLPNLHCLRVGPLRKSLLDQLAGLELPLEELQFCRYATIDGTLKLVDFIRGLGKFANTLIHLQILVDLPDYEFTENFKLDSENKFLFPYLKKLSTTRFNFHTEWFRTMIPKTCPNLEEIHIDRVKQETELMVIKEKAFKRLQNLKMVILYYEKKGERPVRMVLHRPTLTKINK